MSTPIEQPEREVALPPSVAEAATRRPPTKQRPKSSAVAPTRSKRASGSRRRGGAAEGKGAGKIAGQGKYNTKGGDGKSPRRAGRVRMGSGTTSGFCRKGDITSTVRRQAGSIRSCYETRLQAKPTIGGKLTLRWTIDLNGRVRSAGITANSLGDRAVTGCILRVVRRMQFAKPDGGACDVQWPFVFTPGQ